MTQRYFATTLPGFEGLLAGNIAALGAKKLDELDGGVEYDATHKTFYRSVYELRMANRVLLRVDEFRSRDFPELYNKTRRFGWERLLDGGNRIYVKGVSTESRLTHTGRIAETVAEAISEHFTDDLGQSAPEVVDSRDGAQYILARLDGDRCQLNLDAAGDLLHRRGWRQQVGDAPIRETTAAAVLEALDWEGDGPLYDPMCGSGTFPIQAARIGTNRPAGEFRDFAFHRWANFRPDLWKEVVEDARGRVFENRDRVCYGTDLDREAVRIASWNARSAEVDELTSFERAPVSEIEPPTDEVGLVVSNPPYGERLDAGSQGAEAWRVLVDRFAEKFRGWTLALILPREVEPAHEYLGFDALLDFRNGGIPVRLWCAEHDTTP